MSIYNLGGGGGAPVLEQRTVTPTTSQQIIKPTRDEYDGLSQVTVEATPLEARTVNPSKYTSTIFPSDPNIGFSSVTVNGVSLQSKTLTPSTLPYTITSDASYLGLSQATVQKPSTLIASNIKSGVSIFGVTGTLKPEKPQASGTVTTEVIDGKICLRVAGVPRTATRITAVNIKPESTVTGTNPLTYLWWYTAGGVWIESDIASLKSYMCAALLPGGTGTTATVGFFKYNNYVYMYATGRASDGQYTLTLALNSNYVIQAMYE